MQGADDDTLRGLSRKSRQRDACVWDTLWEGRSIGRIAVAVMPSAERTDAAKGMFAELDEGTGQAPSGDRSRQWRQDLCRQAARLAAQMQLPGDAFPALPVPRSVHGQSQGICDVFGAEMERDADGYYFVHPLPPDPARIGAIEPRPLDQSLYWGAVQWLREARAWTDGTLAFRNPVMTSPFDTANYLLGTTVLMHWVYDEPDALHALLATITDVIARMLIALREAAGGQLHGDATACMRGGVCLCSECRSIVSRSVYEEFEAPYLARLGERLGPYAIHACGGWERTVPSALADTNLRAMNGQIRENDLGELCRLADGKIALSIGPSCNLDERFTWSDITDFYRHVLETVPPSQPFELGVPECDVPIWNDLCDRLRCPHNRIPPMPDIGAAPEP